MRRTSTTVLAVVGDDADAVLDALGRAPNVVTVTPAGDDALSRAVEAWSAAQGAHAPWFAHAADPLTNVATAWAAHYDGEGTPGDLEVAIAELLARWRVGSVELPDYYLVSAPERLPTTLRHWYLGVLHAAARVRVAPVDAALAAVNEVRRLGPGPWWPPLDRMLAGIDRVVPDRVGVTTT